MAEKKTDWRATYVLSNILTNRIRHNEKLTKEDVQKIKELIADGADINWVGTKNDPLFYEHRSYIIKYVEQNDIDSVKALAKLGADVNARYDWCNRSALMRAIEMGHLEVAKALIELGADVNVRDCDGCSARMIGGTEDQPKVIKMFAECGADLNSTDRNGKTDCMWAAVRGSTETVRAFAESGADVNVKCDGWTACMFAAKGGYTDTIKELAKFGADLDAQDEKGMTACMIAAYWSDSKELQMCPFTGAYYDYHKNQMNTVISLAELGADIYIKDKKGRTVLDYVKDVKTKQAIVAAHQKYLKNTKGKNASLQETLSLVAKANILKKASEPLRKKHSKEIVKAAKTGKPLSKEEVHAMHDKEGRARAKAYKTLLERRFGKLK